MGPCVIAPHIIAAVQTESTTRAKPITRLTVRSSRKDDNAGAAAVRPSMAGKVPIPKTNIVTAPLAGFAVDAAVIRTV